MDRQAFYRQLDEILECDTAITGATLLKEQEGWNSMAVISLIAMVDNEYALTLPPLSIVECQTADDLAALVEHHLSGAASR
jgi:acyl carrier protein